MDGVLGLVGVVIGFLLGWAKDWQDKRIETARSKRKLASALLSESIALRERYQDVFGNQIQEWLPGKPLTLGGYVRTTNAFAVYDGNTSNLGLFALEDAQFVVRAYTLGKGHVESIGEIAAIIEDRMRSIRPYDATENPIGKILRAQLQKEIDEQFGPMLKRESSALHEAGERAIQVLQGYSRR